MGEQSSDHNHKHEHAHNEPGHTHDDHADFDHDHDHDDHRGQGHEHGKVDADLYGNKAGLRAVQIATAGMFIVAALQFAIAGIGGSADTLFPYTTLFRSVLTTVALWIAFVISNRAANQRYTYGYYRAEDLAGIFIVLVIIASAAAGAWESIQKLTSGSAPTQLLLSMAAAIVGVAGNEILAHYKIAVGKRINSVPLVADGQHSRIDGLTSLAALIGLIGVAFGLRIADPIAGLVITVVILTVVYSTSRSVLQRLLDAVDPHIVPSIIATASEVPGVEGVDDVRARWVGHTLHIIMNIKVDAEMTLARAHEIAEEVRHRLFHRIDGVSEAIIHTDPHSVGEGAVDHHQLLAHHLQEAQRPIVQR